MKQIKLLTIAVLLIASTSHAQINKGVNALGGNLSFGTSSIKNGNNSFTNTSLLISPSFMTAYKNNRAVGFNLSYQYSKSNYANQKTNGYGTGVFLRQYKPLGKGFYVFAQEALNFQYSKISPDTTNFINSKTISIAFTANPGIAYDLSKKVQLELLLFNNFLSAEYSYLSSTSIASSTIKSNNFHIGANLDGSQLTSLNIGAKIFFGR